MSDPYVGEIRMVGFSYAPQGWALCNGQLYSITQNQALFSLLGTVYGGDGISTFGVPNLQGRTPIHYGFPPSGSSFTLGQTGGEENHTLLPTEIPAHVHPLTGDASTPASSNFAQPSGASLGLVAAQVNTGTTVPFAFYSDAAASTTLDSRALASNGGGQSHPNLQPFLVMYYIIALTGIYPARG